MLCIPLGRSTPIMSVQRRSLFQLYRFPQDRQSISIQAATSEPWTTSSQPMTARKLRSPPSGSPGPGLWGNCSSSRKARCYHSHQQASRQDLWQDQRRDPAPRVGDHDEGGQGEPRQPLDFHHSWGNDWWGYGMPFHPFLLLENVPQLRTNSVSVPLSLSTSGSTNYFQHDGRSDPKMKHLKSQKTFKTFFLIFV